MSQAAIDQHRREQATQRAAFIVGRYVAEHPDGVLTRHIANHSLSIEAAYDILKDISRDPKTGLSRADLLSMTISYELERAAKDHQPLTIGVFDLDYFKALNDVLTHIGADHILRRVGEILHEQIRSSDDILQATEEHDVVRWGGEEFVIVFPNTALEAASIAAERIRVAVMESIHIPELEGKCLTISGGLAIASNHDTWEALLKRADERVFLAKRNGRNRIES